MADNSKKQPRRLTPAEEDSAEETVVTPVRAKVRTEAEEEGQEQATPAPDGLLEGVGMVVRTPEVVAAEALTRPTNPKEIVNVTFLRSVDHPITVGHFRSIDYGLTSFPQGSEASLPWCAVEVLLDRKIVVLR